MPEKPNHPVFDQYSLDQLHELTGYSPHYLLSIRDGYQPVRPAFRYKLAAILNRPESELFTPEPAREGAA